MPLAVKLSAGTSLIIEDSVRAGPRQRPRASNCRSEPGNPSVWRVPFALAVISPNFASRASCVSSPASFNWASTFERARCNDWQPKVLEHPADVRMLEDQCEIRTVQGVESAEAAIDAELQPFDCSLHRHADVPPGEKRIDGTDVTVHFRPVLVEPAFAGDCQQAVLAGFDGQGLELRDAVRVTGFAIGHLDIAELCVLDDCRDFRGARVARGLLRRISPPLQRTSCRAPSRFFSRRTETSLSSNERTSTGPETSDHSPTCIEKRPTSSICGFEPHSALPMRTRSARTETDGTN